ncbi:hypothetical protein BDQ17DRAFT_1327798 [Cyathus striatus]|nr:hypothetical protein BDQ17DRAFT_1327798 [Cyathus striatus]
MAKHVSSFSAQLVTFDTDLPFSEVISRLDREINKPETGNFLTQLASATTREEIINAVNSIKGPSDFLFFGELKHHQWLSIYDGIKRPAAVNYMIGNPLIAETILRHDMRAALFIPPRLTVLEKDEGKGTRLIYHLPSSLVEWLNDEKLLAAVRYLDDKLEQLMVRVTSK